MSQPSESAPLPHPPQAPTPEQSSAQAKPQQVMYEFTPMQDDIIRVLSKRMKFVGVFYVIASALVGLAGLAALFVVPLLGLVYLILLTPELLIGIWTIKAAHSFRLVVETRGHDVPHLMSALTSLRKLYTMMFWILVIGLGLMVLAIAAAIFLWTSGLIPIPTESSTVTSML